MFFCVFLLFIVYTVLKFQFMKESMLLIFVWSFGGMYSGREMLLHLLCHCPADPYKMDECSQVLFLLQSPSYYL